MKAPDLGYYRQAKEMLSGLYSKYRLEPAGANGINVCIERDVWRLGRESFQ